MRSFVGNTQPFELITAAVGLKAAVDKTKGINAHKHIRQIKQSWHEVIFDRPSNQSASTRPPAGS